ncbi:MAG: hypothetical protein CSA84_05830 [Actinomycetales bacterium]|nr:MAG: hypothetical protein CSA84_05830 [Actinomycetales bacterium]
MSGEVNRVHVWWAYLTLAQSGLHAYVSPAESERASSYRSPADQGRSLVAAALLRIAASDALDLDASAIRVDRRCHECGRPHGKPRIDGINVSVSHAGLLVAVATAPIPVGIDVERVADLTRSGHDGGIDQWCAAEARTKLGDCDTVTCQELTAPMAGYGACLAVAAARPAQLVLHDPAASARAVQRLGHRDRCTESGDDHGGR